MNDNYSEKILQFGEGNFLRAFIEDYIEEANCFSYSGKVVVCQPRNNNKIINLLNSQNCRYDIIKRGMLNGRLIDERKHINCISRCIDSTKNSDDIIKLFCDDKLEIIVSNTTEAGIVFNKDDTEPAFYGVTFPARLTYLLYQRYKLAKKGLVFFPCELIENNGDELKSCMLNYARLWEFDNGFFRYIEHDCSFCNTLVDRIVTGHSDGDSDVCSITCEPYRLLVIDCDDRAKAVLPFNDDSVIYTDNLSLYRERKVKILNGIHTLVAPGAYISDIDIVRDAVKNEKFSAMIDSALSEICQTIDLDNKECMNYASTVLERFSNPFIDHKLFDITLNSISKYKSRILPSVIGYVKIHGTAPVTLSRSLAYLIAFYNHKSQRSYEPNDSDCVIEFFKTEPSVKEVMATENFWGMNLNTIPGMTKIVEEFYNEI